MSSRNYLLDVATRRQIFIQRYSGTQTALLYEWLDRISAELSKALESTPADQISQRLVAQQQLFSNYFEDVSNEYYQMTLDFAEDEMDFFVGAYNEAAEVSFITPSMVQVDTILRNKDIIPDPKKTLTIQGVLSNFKDATARQIRQSVNDGILLGKTTPQISKEVNELLGGLSRNQADAVSRTIINASSSVAKQEVFNDNQAFLEGEEWIATLDSRTTFECAGRDGNTYPVGKAPQIPAHYNCRSTLSPVIKKEFRDDTVKGSRFAKGSDGTEKVSDKTDFNSWLKKQDAGFQKEYLGPQRYELYKKGGLTIDKFRDETGKVYTLEELKQLEPTAFGKAKLDI